MWDAVNDLIPRGKENESVIVYLPKGTGQPRMYADTFYGEYIASWSRDDDHNWALSTYTHPEQHRFRLFRKSPWAETFFSDDIFLDENATMSKSENTTVNHQLCQLCASDPMEQNFMVEGVSECYDRAATRQDVEVTAGIRIMDGCGIDTVTRRR